jgi:signal transduction histidine kinase
MAGLDRALLSDEAREVRSRRLWAEAALILFLRAHPEIAHLIITLREDGGPGELTLIAAGRRGGVPVAWRPSGASALASAAITTFVDLSRPGTDERAVLLIAGLDVGMLLDTHDVGTDDVTCALQRQDGAPLDSSGPDEDAGEAASGGRLLRAEEPVAAEGWSCPGPWALSCAQPESSAVGVLASVVDRYRLTLALNLGVMSLTVFLGMFAIRQIRRRERLEWAASEESRVREVERQLFHSERLATVGRLAAGFAHEINNPLEGTVNYLHLAEEALGRGDAEAAGRRLAQVHEGLERVSGVVRQILDHADPATGSMSRIDLRKGISQALDFVRTRKEFKGIRFVVNLEDGPSEVAGHEALLGQVLLNLLLNACEAQPGAGEVKVTMRREDEAMVLEIADRGPGIKQEDAARIFEPFYSTKGSTGLGLSICHAIVRQHRGELSASEQLGGGALLRLSLPAQPRDTEEPG